jgi:hypothetical protein
MKRKEIEVYKSILRFLVLNNGHCGEESLFSFFAIDNKYNRNELLDGIEFLESNKLITIDDGNTARTLHIATEGILSAGMSKRKFAEYLNQDIKNTFFSLSLATHKKELALTAAALLFSIIIAAIYYFYFSNH